MSSEVIDNYYHNYLKDPPTPAGGKRRVRVALSGVYFLVYTSTLFLSFPVLGEGAGGGSWAPVSPKLKVPSPPPNRSQSNPSRNSLGPSWNSLSYEPPALRHSRAPRAPTIAPMTTLARKMVPKWDPKMKPGRASDK